ncbi:MAG: transposase [Sphaerochaeta sp.]|nr:transposase [Sphaerochaeta sp.]
MWKFFPVPIIRRRIARLDDDDIVAIDSTSKSSYGDCLAYIKWGKNKEGVKLRQTNEVVVYSLRTHMPVYYRSFPGNMTDARTLAMIYRDLEDAGFKDIPVITDRGYETIETLETYILKGRPLIMCTKTSQKFVSSVIDSLGVMETGLRPDCMELDLETELYYYQCDVQYDMVSIHGTVKPTKGLKLNLYLDPVRRSRECIQVESDVIVQRLDLAQALGDALIVKDEKAFKSEVPYYDVIIDKDTKMLTGYALNSAKVSKAIRFSGYFAIVTFKVAGDAQAILRLYKLRDEQEKYFNQMKTQMLSDRNRTWSEEGYEGRQLIAFVGLILSSYTKHIWKSTGLCEKVTTTLEILDEMRSIRCIEHNHKAKFITPFVGNQLVICEAFGFAVPKGCDTGYKSKKHVEKKKRGRPPKAQNKKVMSS